MGTTPNGKRPSNDITISRSNVTKSVDPVTGRGENAEGQAQPAPKMPDRSFAQPSPVAQPKVVTPKAHASEQDEKNALKKNSALKQPPKVEEKTEETKDAE